MAQNKKVSGTTRPATAGHAAANKGSAVKAGSAVKKPPVDAMKTDEKTHAPSSKSKKVIAQVEAKSPVKSATKPAATQSKPAAKPAAAKPAASKPQAKKAAAAPVKAAQV